MVAVAYGHGRPAAPEQGNRVIGLAQRLFRLAQFPGHRRFRNLLGDPRAAQEGVLAAILRDNAGSAFGREHRFGDVSDSDSFRGRVALSDYADIEPLIQRLRRGEADLLFSGRPSLFEPSGGSSSGPRLIPYTAALQRQFQAGLAPWIFDLYRRYPEIQKGPAYWAITPVGALKQEQTGFESDASYFGGPAARLVAAFQAVPASVSGITDMREYRLETLRHLLKAGNLRLISVWNPSFLTLLMEALPELSPLSPAELWPDLRLISCWADAHAASAVPALKALFPHAEIQPKGLLATEAIVSLPYEGRYPLAIASHFFEFLDAEGRSFPCWEVEEGKDYSVVVTTAGGLYRYRLRDRVRITGFLKATPCVQFLGKEDCVSDTCGEKLEEVFVAAALKRIYATHSMQPAFSILAPERDRGGFHYVLYLEGESPADLSESLELELNGNFHYAYCRRLKQLGPPRVQRVPPGTGVRYLSHKASEGRQLGAIKALSLDPRLDIGGLQA